MSRYIKEKNSKKQMQRVRDKKIIEEDPRHPPLSNAEKCWRYRERRRNAPTNSTSDCYLEITAAPDEAGPSTSAMQSCSEDYEMGLLIPTNKTRNASMRVERDTMTLQDTSASMKMALGKPPEMSTEITIKREIDINIEVEDHSLDLQIKTENVTCNNEKISLNEEVNIENNDHQYDNMPMELKQEVDFAFIPEKEITDETVEPLEDMKVESRQVDEEMEKETENRIVAITKTENIDFENGRVEVKQEILMEDDSLVSYDYPDFNDAGSMDSSDAAVLGNVETCLQVDGGSNSESVSTYDMAFNEPSTSQCPPAKKRRPEDIKGNPRRINTEEEIQQLYDDAQGSEDDLDCFFDSDSSSDCSTNESETITMEKTLRMEVQEEIQRGLEQIPQPLEPSTSNILSNPLSLPKVHVFEGMKITPSQSTPMDYFELFFTPEFYQYLADETNNYSKNLLFEIKSARSRILEWKDVNPEEMKKFIGLIFLMGIIRINRLNECWKKHYLFNLSYSKFMSRDRFLLILRYLHFEKAIKSNDPIFKIRPLMNYFNSKMEELCHQPRELTVDESMLLWRGQLTCKQFIKNKPFKYDMKLYVLAELNGLIHKIHVDSVTKDAKVNNEEHDCNIVGKMVQEKQEIEHSLFTHNTHNSLKLTEDLNETCKRAYIRKDNPPRILKNNKKVTAVTCNAKEGFCCKWRDKKDRKKNKIQLIVKDNMKGLDQHDQMLNYYPFHKNLRYYKKMGINLFHIILNNAYLLYNMYSDNKKYDLHDFHVEIICNLLPEPPKQNPVISDVIHLPDFLIKASDNRTMRKRCRVCFKKKVRKDSSFGCSLCPGFPGLCLNPCFREYHGYK